MRVPNNTTLPMALLSATLLFTAACASDQPREEAADYEGQPGTVQTAPDAQEVPTQDDSQSDPEATEIQGPDDDLVVDPEADQIAELEERERRIAERQAELEAREERLREARERREQEADRADRAEPRATPRVEAPRRPAPAPVPEREREREQVAERREADRPRETAPEPDDREDSAVPDPVESRAAREERENAERREARRERERRLVTSVAVPDGTILNVRFTDTVSSNGSQVGDTFRARVASDILEGGQVVIPAGSEVLGEVSEAVPLDRRIGGQARLTLRFTDLVLPSGTTMPIRASFLRQGRNETGRDAAVIGGGAAGGAVLGRILGGSKDRSRGTLVGAILGAAAGAVIASRTPGEEVVIPDGATVDLVLDEEIEVQVED